VRGTRDEFSTGEMMECVECLHICDSRQNDGGGKEGEESLRALTPPSASLGQVLKARERHDTLTTTLGDDGGQSREWGNVREFVEGE
jgi:hypothetical protein